MEHEVVTNFDKSYFQKHYKEVTADKIRNQYF